MGVVVDALLRRGDAHQAQHLDGPLSGLGLGHLLVLQDHLHDLVAHGVDRVEGGHGILEDHGDLLAAHPAHLPLAVGEDVLVLEEDLPVHHPAGVLEQAHDGEAGHALAAAALPHDAQHLALIQVEADAADGLDLAHVGEKGGLQIPNGK